VALKFASEEESRIELDIGKGDWGKVNELNELDGNTFIRGKPGRSKE
jgi:hypothetical protein